LLRAITQAIKQRAQLRPQPPKLLPMRRRELPEYGVAVGRQGEIHLAEVGGIWLAISSADALRWKELVHHTAHYKRQEVVLRVAKGETA
jgi:hypothetical protein